MVRIHFENTQQQWLLRAGMVVRHVHGDDAEEPAYLNDNDADEAYWLARQADPGQLMAGTDATFSLRGSRDRPVGDLVMPLMGASFVARDIRPPGA